METERRARAAVVAERARAAVAAQEAQRTAASAARSRSPRHRPPATEAGNRLLSLHRLQRAEAAAKKATEAAEACWKAGTEAADAVLEAQVVISALMADSSTTHRQDRDRVVDEVGVPQADCL